MGTETAATVKRVAGAAIEPISMDGVTLSPERKAAIWARVAAMLPPAPRAEMPDAAVPQMGEPKPVRTIANR